MTGFTDFQYCNCCFKMAANIIFTVMYKIKIYIGSSEISLSVYPHVPSISPSYHFKLKVARPLMIFLLLHTIKHYLLQLFTMELYSAVGKILPKRSHYPISGWRQSQHWGVQPPKKCPSAITLVCLCLEITNFYLDIRLFSNQID